jgi:hypothetical protein
MSRVLPLSCLGKSCPPCAQDLSESPPHGQSERTLHEGVAARPSDQGGCELFEGGIEVASTQPHVVHSKRDEALSGVVLNGTR